MDESDSCLKKTGSEYCQNNDQINILTYDGDICYIDIETTGLPDEMGRYDNVRAVQIAWLISNKKGDIKLSKSYIIKPENFIVPTTATDIHGITHERAMNEGILFEQVYKEF